MQSIPGSEFASSLLQSAVNLILRQGHDGRDSRHGFSDGDKAEALYFAIGEIVYRAG